MTTAELKAQIYKKIDKIEDERLLEDINEVLDNTGNSEIKFEQWEIEQIKESERQIQRGEFYTEDEANKLTEKWFEGK
jgi:predicted transcriptional regulator